MKVSGDLELRGLERCRIYFGSRASRIQEVRKGREFWFLALVTVPVVIIVRERQDCDMISVGMG